MAGIETLSFDDLVGTERAEVDDAMRADAKGPAGFLRDNNDIVVLWLLMLMAGVGGIVFYFVGGVPLPYAREAGLLVGISLLLVTPWIWVRNHNRRGCLFTTYGTFLVRASGLKGVRHADVKAIKCWTVRRKRSGNFTVFEVVTNGGRTLTIYTHPKWAAGATAAIQLARGGNIPVSDR